MSKHNLLYQLLAEAVGMSDSDIALKVSTNRQCLGFIHYLKQYAVKLILGIETFSLNHH